MNNFEAKIDALLEYQPGLKHVKENVIEGSLHVNRNLDSCWVNREFKIKIELNQENVFFSHVYDKENYIEKTFPHINHNGSFCLATPIDLLLASLNDDSLVAFCKNFIETFLFSYEYYKRYNMYPFEDRAHGAKGVLESYMELTQIYDSDKLIEFLSILIKKKNQYGKNAFCPCKSGKKVRVCHKEFIDLLSCEQVVKQVKKDVRIMELC